MRSKVKHTGGFGDDAQVMIIQAAIVEPRPLLHYAKY